MNKDKLEVGDLVIWAPGRSSVGLVIEGLDHWQYRVYWFYAGKVKRHTGKYLIKLDIPNE